MLSLSNGLILFWKHENADNGFVQAVNFIDIEHNIFFNGVSLFKFGTQLFTTKTLCGKKKWKGWGK